MKMKFTSIALFLVFTCCSALLSQGQSTQSLNLTGRWSANDGGTYYLRQLGDQLWWYGQSGDGGATWSNVYQGVIRGEQISGRWADVPLGRIQGAGVMDLMVNNPNQFTATNRTGGFNGSVWTRQGAPVVGGGAIPPSSAGGVFVDAANPPYFSMSSVLQAGRQYVVEASGTWSYWSDKIPDVNEGGGVDPVWCYAKWRCPTPAAWQTLRIDGKGMAELAGQPLPYNPQHGYRIVVTGEGRPVKLEIGQAHGGMAGGANVRIYPR